MSTRTRQPHRRNHRTAGRRNPRAPHTPASGLHFVQGLHRRIGTNRMPKRRPPSRPRRQQGAAALRPHPFCPHPTRRPLCHSPAPAQPAAGRVPGQKGWGLHVACQHTTLARPMPRSRASPCGRAPTPCTAQGKLRQRGPANNTQHWPPLPQSIAPGPLPTRTATRRVPPAPPWRFPPLSPPPNLEPRARAGARAGQPGPPRPERSAVARLRWA